VSPCPVLTMRKASSVITDINKLTRDQTLRNRSTTVHKFPLGAYVLHRIGARSEKMSFRVSRLLPDGGEGLQYRIKGERDGQERVVTECSLEKINNDLLDIRPCLIPRLAESAFTP
jgi:hypothetical protein